MRGRSYDDEPPQHLAARDLCGGAYADWYGGLSVAGGAFPAGFSEVLAPSIGTYYKAGGSASL